MNWSKLSQAERTAVVAAVIVVVTALLSLSNDWGILMAVSLLAGLGVLAVVFLPAMAPNMALPGSRGSLLLALGAIGAVATIVVALGWVNWILGHLASFDTLQFLVGLVAAVVMAWAGWQVLQAEGGKFRIGTAGQAPPAPPPSA
jgi:hypothetical protein